MKLTGQQLTTIFMDKMRTLPEEEMAKGLNSHKGLLAVQDAVIDANKSGGATGIELIAEERQRQISVEGWTPEHDDGHGGGQLSAAAACYADAATIQARDEKWTPEDIHSQVSEYWPWETEWFKPSVDPIRNLQKAGALIAAEIDRLQRKGEK